MAHFAAVGYCSQWKCRVASMTFRGSLVKPQTNSSGANRLESFPCKAAGQQRGPGLYKVGTSQLLPNRCIFHLCREKNRRYHASRIRRLSFQSPGRAVRGAQDISTRPVRESRR